MAIEPKTKQDQENGDGRSVCPKNPTFKVFTHEDTGQTIIAGMGELHLEIIRDRMFRIQGGRERGQAAIAYRETITNPADGEGALYNQVAAVSTARSSRCIRTSAVKHHGRKRWS
jgi:elongation factor G